MRKSLDGGPTNTHTQKPHVRETEEEVEAESESKAGMRREIRSNAMRCEVMYVWDEMMYICNGLLSSSCVKQLGMYSLVCQTIAVLEKLRAAETILQQQFGLA